MKLESKLLLSYLLIIGIVLLILSVTTATLAPVTFDREVLPTMMMMHGNDAYEEMQVWPVVELVARVQQQFRASLFRSLLLAGLAAVAASVLVSWAISQRIVRPLNRMASASLRIAAGHYDERMEASSAQDELGDLTRSFNQMAEALEATEEMRQQLIADVSHELKTPLASIKGYMEGLQDGVIEASPETYELIHREATRLQRLTHSLQELSRAEASQLNIEPRQCDLSELTRSAVEWLRPQFDSKQVSLITDLPPEPLEARADYDRLKQVLTNILGNALQYTPPSGEVSVTLRKDGKNAHFTVRDNGAGIPPDEVKLIFQRFYRVDKSRARASGGSGIGLTIAYHIVDAHEGRIWAESDGIGQGSAFHFTVPLG